MHLVLDLGHYYPRYLDRALALIDDLKENFPTVSVFVHLLDCEKGHGVDAIDARQRLGQHVSDGHIRVTPFPASRWAVKDAPAFEKQLQRRLVARISDFAIEPLSPSAVVRLVPEDQQSGAVFTDGMTFESGFPDLTLDPDSAASGAGKHRLYEWLEELVKSVPSTQVGSPAKPRLAFVSPLPPLQTGIADYSVELLEALEAHYTITLIVEQVRVEPESLARRFAIRDSQWFMAHGDTFDRVLYHWGNSQHHTHMLALLDRHPGCVVLHDFFSGDAIKHIADQQGDFAQVLYAAHGYPAIAEYTQSSTHVQLEKTLRHYPLNHPVVSRATGVLVHSQYALNLARQWYPEHQLDDWQHVPFLRLLPDGDESRIARRQSAREKLGIAQNEFVVCTFGLITPNKCTQQLFDAFTESDLAQKSHVRLVAVGGYGHDAYQRQIQQWLKTYSQVASVEVTGYADAETYRHYLQAADIGVQLRANSRGETSAAVFDCLAAGLPMIANAHGSVAELPTEVACLIPDEVEVTTLREALETLYHDGNYRQKLSEAGQRYVRQEHGPEAVGQAYAKAIEQLHHQSRLGRYRTLLNDLSRLEQQEGQLLYRQADLHALSEAIDIAQPTIHGPRLLIDVSNIANHDLRTGIERVTRNLCEIFLNTPPENYRVELVRSLGGEWYYARAYAAERLGLEPVLGGDEPCTPRQGDIYLSLEWSPPVLANTFTRFQAMRALGVKLYFTVFDALPMQFPQHFPDFVEGTYEDWLSRVLMLADGLCCISAAVADDIRVCAYQLPEPLRPKGELPHLGHFHLGADFTARAASQGLRPQDHVTLEKLEGETPVLLMVGTLEPRKGHALVISAMEHLWQRGSHARLVIVGKLGWKMDAMAKRLNDHAERGQRLFWIEGASDDMLAELYRTSSALVAASEGEGFGLPLIEAAQRGIPIIARDIPVFREVAGEHASFFSAADSEGLAEELQEWFDTYQLGQVPSVDDMPWLSWEQSAEQLLDQVLPVRHD
ncbi:glycosyltransferase [Halomonas sp. HMF6819]|uniref:glycosyltransferase n=1 Tax=Halomonas sp. HMF6819 TaxID=3373085 RepID=UPI0037B94BD0